MKIFLFGFVVMFTLISCNQSPVLVKHQIQGEAQGTYYAITYYDVEENDLRPQFDSILQAFDLSASNYHNLSIISKVNRNEEVELDDVFKGNFNLAMEVAALTDGDFDITVRPLVNAWGFGQSKINNMDSTIVDSLMQFVGYRKVKIQNGRIVKQDPRLQLDFDALAQGYSVDVLAKWLSNKGLKHYLVDVGGEVFASEMKLDSSLWKVGVEQPKDRATYGENLAAVLPLSNQGMATSGNYRKFYVKDGVRYSHTINPHTGYPAAQTLLSTTVIAANAATADAFATAFMVMGLEKTKAFVAQHPELEVYLIFSDSTGEFQHFATERIQEILLMNEI
jgi:thiamine biosynthesis lipoprotein